MSRKYYLTDLLFMASRLGFDERSAKFADNITDLERQGKVPKLDLFIASSAIVSSKILITSDSDFEIFKKTVLSLKRKI